MATNLNVTELDFDQIKKNLKNYLKTQSTFNSYDFEGSGLSSLLDVLAYNTHYNAMTAHFALNEALHTPFSSSTSSYYYNYSRRLC